MLYWFSEKRQLQKSLTTTAFLPSFHNFHYSDASCKNTAGSSTGKKMETLSLRPANYEDLEEEWLFVQAMPEDENGLTNRWHAISREEFEKTALPDMIRYAKGIGLPDWMVPETFYFLWKDEKIIGQFRIRHYLNDSLREGSGHIGQFIAKEYRGKGYGTAGLRLTLEEACRIVPEDEIYLRVNKDNPASLHVMLKNNGTIVAEDESHYFVRIKKFGA